MYLLVGPLLQFAFDQDSHILEEGNLRIAQLTGPDVQHAQGANAALTHKQRTSCVEANPRTSADVWVVGKTGIFKCIWDHKQLACRHGVRTERCFTRSLPDLDPMGRLEPLALPVNQTNERYRYADDSGGEASKSVEALFFRCIKNTQVVESGEALLFILR